MYYVFCMFYMHELLYSSSIFYKVKSWLKMWEVDGEKARHFYRLLFDALTEDRQRCSVHVIYLQNGNIIEFVAFFIKLGHKFFQDCNIFSGYFRMLWLNLTCVSLILVTVKKQLL